MLRLLACLLSHCTSFLHFADSFPVLSTTSKAWQKQVLKRASWASLHLKYPHHETQWSRLSQLVQTAKSVVVGYWFDCKGLPGWEKRLVALINKGALQSLTLKDPVRAPALELVGDFRRLCVLVSTCWGAPVDLSAADLPDHLEVLAVPGWASFFSTLGGSGPRSVGILCVKSGPPNSTEIHVGHIDTLKVSASLGSHPFFDWVEWDPNRGRTLRRLGLDDVWRNKSSCVAQLVADNRAHLPQLRDLVIWVGGVKESENVKRQELGQALSVKMPLLEDFALHLEADNPSTLYALRSSADILAALPNLKRWRVTTVKKYLDVELDFLDPACAKLRMTVSESTSALLQWAWLWTNGLDEDNRQPPQWAGRRRRAVSIEFECAAFPTLEMLGPLAFFCNDELSLGLPSKAPASSGANDRVPAFLADLVARRLSPTVFVDTDTEQALTLGPSTSAESNVRQLRHMYGFTEPQELVIN